jgi:transketolase
MEAGVTALWHRYVGDSGRVIGIDRFGMSAPGDTVLRELGMTAEHFIKVAQGVCTENGACDLDDTVALIDAACGT